MKKKQIFGKRHIAFAICIASSLAFLSAIADTYIVVNKNAKVFDEPNATGYVTLNQKNEEVTVLPGMVFKSLENRQGWNKVEYSPGLHGYISDQVKQAKCSQPKAGTYKVGNKPADKLTVELKDNTWNASIGGKTFRGQSFDNIVIFFDEKKVPVYSLVDLGEGPIVMTYDNSVTGFF